MVGVEKADGRRILFGGEAQSWVMCFIDETFV